MAEEGTILWLRDETNKCYRKAQCDENGYLKLDMSSINLGDLGDVSVPSPTDQDFLYYDGATELWKCGALVDSDIPATIARDAEVTSAIAAHAALTSGVHGLGIGARVFHSVQQSIPSGTDTLLNFDTELYDTDNIHDNVTNNTRLTCKTAGLYLIIGGASFYYNATGRRYLGIKKNNTSWEAVHSWGKNQVSYTHMQALALDQLSVNDYVELVVYQNSGGALNILLSYYYTPSFMMQRVG